MKRWIIFFFVAMGISIASKAQDGFRVDGKIEGVPDGPLLLMTFDRGVPDTLGFVQTANGFFTFTGNVKDVTAAYIMTTDRKGVIPILLENTEFVVHVGRVIEVVGGTQQNIYNQFLAINQELETQQKRMKEEAREAQMKGNTMVFKTLRKEAEEMMERAGKRGEELLKEHGDTYAAAYALSSEIRRQDPEVLKAKFALLGEQAKATPPGRSVAALLTAYAKVAVGQVAPDFTVRASDGKTLSLSDIKGKLKLIDFWASWCVPCRQENPNMLKIFRKYHELGLEILGVSLDKDPRAWMQAVNDDKLPWRQGIDGGSVSQQYFVRAIPYTLLLDENNVIVAKNLKGQKLREKIEELLENR